MWFTSSTGLVYSAWYHVDWCSEVASSIASFSSILTFLCPLLDLSTLGKCEMLCLRWTLTSEGVKNSLLYVCIIYVSSKYWLDMLMPCKHSWIHLNLLFASKENLCFPETMREAEDGYVHLFSNLRFHVSIILSTSSISL